jgi:two-component system chemotaxis sensor kinase CheA
MTIDLTQFHDAFFEESFEALDSMEAALLKLDIGAPDKELINTIFRVAHSIKGGSATFGFADIASFTHSLETMLDELRSGGMQVTLAMSDLLLKSVDVMRAMLRAVQQKKPIDAQRVSDLQFDLELMIAQKDSAPAAPPPPAAATAPAAVATSAATATPTAPASAAATSAPEATHASAAAPQALAAVLPAVATAKRWEITFRPYPELFARGNDPLRMMRELSELGQLESTVDVSALPSFTALEPQSCYLAWNLVLTADVAESVIRQVFEWAEGDCELQIKLIGTPQAAVVVEAAPVTVPVEIVAPVVTAPPPPPPPVVTSPPKLEAVAKPESAIEKVADSGSIRVSVEKIDELMNTVGELVITQAMLSQLGSKLEGPTAEKLRGGLAQLERNMRELQESVMRVRMLPINVVFSRFPRMVRDLAQRLGKQIELKLTGEQTELDKTVLEKIGDPLVHLVRNSIDHGIESPEKRAAGRVPSRRKHRRRSQR